MTSKVYWYKYSVESDEKFEFNSSFDLSYDPEYIAELAAEDYHSCHDGWESSWPLPFTIFDNCGILLGKYEVDREAVPSFSAREVC